MYNWNVDTARLKKNTLVYIKWKLEQLINFGLGDEKINTSYLKKYWSDINIDPDRKKYLKFLLWPKQP